MSTRGFIAIEKANEPNSYTELLTHYDGYPDHMLTNIIALINRDGLDTVRDTLTAYTLWISINREQPSIEGAEPDENADYGTPEKNAWYAQNYGRMFTPGYGEHEEKYTDPRTIKIDDNPLDTELFSDTLYNEFGYIIHNDGTVDTYANDFPKGWKKIGTTTPSKHKDTDLEKLAEMIMNNIIPD